jgi:hypothetical protein
MRTEIPLMPLAGGRMLGLRDGAALVRERVQSSLDAGREVVLDFRGVEATQSFIDELIGVLILRFGPTVLDSVVFRGCSPTMRAILEFVAADRADQFQRQQH